MTFFLIVVKRPQTNLSTRCMGLSVYINALSLSAFLSISQLLLTITDYQTVVSSEINNTETQCKCACCYHRISYIGSSSYCNNNNSCSSRSRNTNTSRMDNAIYLFFKLTECIAFHRLNKIGHMSLNCNTSKLLLQTLSY